MSILTPHYALLIIYKWESSIVALFSPIEISRDMKFKNNYYVNFSIKEKRIINVFNESNYNNILIAEFNPDVMSFCFTCLCPNGITSTGNGNFPSC